MVLPVLVAMAIGFFCRRSGLLNAQGHAALKTVIGNITLPVVLFNAFLTAEYNAGLVLGFAVVFTACCIACAAGYALRPLVAPHGRFLPFLMSSFEVGMLGYALYGLLAGENGSLSTLAMFDIGQTLFAYTVWLALLKVAGGERADAKSLLKNMFTNPAFCGMALGIVLGALGVGKWVLASPVSGIVTELISFLSAPTACLILIVVGYEFSLKASLLRPVLITVALRLAVMAALCAVSALVVFRFCRLTSSPWRRCWCCSACLRRSSSRCLQMWAMTPNTSLPVILPKRWPPCCVLWPLPCIPWREGVPLL